MSKGKFQVLLYYKYVDIKNPKELLEQQKTLCETFNLKGRIIISYEGINGTLEGKTSDTEKYIKEMNKNNYFKDIFFKKSISNGKAFPKLSIKLRNEIVSAHLGNDIKPTKVCGKYITAEELHEWICLKKEFYIIDMRNDYEQAVGYFKNSLLAPFENFRDLPKVLPKIKQLKGKTIVTVCTGGVRCEKASGFLLQNGFSDVYQLYGGIVSYIEKYPNQDFLGVLYVFDGRVTLGFNTRSKKHQVVGKCKFCLSPAENYFDCKNIYCQGSRHFVSCGGCIKEGLGYCSKACGQLIKPPGGTLALYPGEGI